LQKNSPQTDIMNRVFSPLQQSLITWLLILLTGWATLNALSYVGEVIAILVTAGLIAFLLNYAVIKLQKIVPRPLAAIAVYLTAGLVVVFIALTVVPPVFNQARQLVNNLPSLFQSGQQQLAEFQAWSATHNLPFDVGILEQQLVSRIEGQVQAIAARGLGLVMGTFSWFLDLILILVISFYMLIDGDRVWGTLTAMVSPNIRQNLTESLQRNLQKFVTGQLLLGLFMAVTLTVGFWLLKVPFFLLFAVFIGLMEVIPFVGATLGIGAVCIVVAFLDWWLALEVLALAVALQQVKDNLIAPRIMGNLTGLSPVIIFASLLLGARVAGLLGVILAIPLTGVVKSLLEIVLDPTLPPQTGSFFHNPALEAAPTEELAGSSAANSEDRGHRADRHRAN
jgi:predicted PurR-regulated permease PerM